MRWRCFSSFYHRCKIGYGNTIRENVQRILCISIVLKQDIRNSPGNDISMTLVEVYYFSTRKINFYIFKKISQPMLLVLGIKQSDWWSLFPGSRLKGLENKSEKDRYFWRWFNNWSHQPCEIFLVYRNPNRCKGLENEFFIIVWWLVLALLGVLLRRAFLITNITNHQKNYVFCSIVFNGL